jgi:hypothetical protein
MVGEIMKHFVVLFLIVASVLASSCSNLSKNTVKEGHYLVRNGAIADKTWNETFDLTRASWYHEMTLQFDIMVGKITPQSGFNFWFSPAELAQVNACADFRVFLAYSLDTKAIPYSLVNSQIEAAGFKKIDLIEFKKHFMQHPDAEMNSMRLYQLYGICKTVSDGKPLIFNFPGFSEKTIN